MDFNRAEPTCCITNFSFASSSYRNGAFFVHSTMRNAPYVHLKLGLVLELCRAFQIASKVSTGLKSTYLEGFLEN